MNKQEFFKSLCDSVDDMECCICGRKAPEVGIIVQLGSPSSRGARQACIPHVVEAVTRSDDLHFTVEEWFRLGIKIGIGISQAESSEATEGTLDLS